MEFRFEEEFLIRHSRRPRHDDGAIRPDYKIFQYDWNAVKIKINNYDDNKILEPNYDEEKKQYQSRINTNSFWWEMNL